MLNRPMQNEPVNAYPLDRCINHLKTVMGYMTAWNINKHYVERKCCHLHNVITDSRKTRPWCKKSQKMKTTQNWFTLPYRWQHILIRNTRKAHLIQILTLMKQCVSNIIIPGFILQSSLDVGIFNPTLIKQCVSNIIPSFIL